MPATKQLPLEEAKSPETYQDKQVEHATLTEAKLAVMRDVEYVLKTKPASGGGINYQYLSEAEILKVLRPALIRHGITVYPCGVELLGADSWNTKSGGVSHRVRFIFTYRMELVAQPDQFNLIQTVGEAMDSGDKAANKSMTAGLKYALRQAFLMESTDDPDKWASQEVISQASSLDQQLVEAFFRFEGAILSAESKESLDKFKARYESRGFDKVHLDKLNEGYEKRLASLTKAS